MKYTEIIKLLDAGYSRDEIIAMDTQDPADDPTPVDDPTPAADPIPADIRSITDTVVTDLKDAITQLKNEITAMNIMSSRIEPEAESQDVIAQIINPVRKENK